MNQISSAISNLYAILLVLGGIMGFIKAHSRMSLITGVISGILVFLACKIGEKKPKEGYLFVSAVSLVLSIFFASRFSHTHAFMPSGLMLILSVTTFAVVGLSWLKKGKK